MSDTSMTCEEFREISTELALNTLGGERRAAALSHLEHCVACRHELLQLTEVADNLADLAPLAEPPAGFETRVLAYLGLPVPAGEPTQPLQTVQPPPPPPPGWHGIRQDSAGADSADEGSAS